MDTQTVFELYNKINALESRVYYLEKQLEQSDKRTLELKNDIPSLPDTKLLSNNLMTRSFIIFGHYTAAKMIVNLIVSIVVILNWGLVVSQFIKAITPITSPTIMPTFMP